MDVIEHVGELVRGHGCRWICCQLPLLMPLHTDIWLCLCMWLREGMCPFPCITAGKTLGWALPFHFTDGKTEALLGAAEGKTWRGSQTSYSPSLHVHCSPGTIPPWGTYLLHLAPAVCPGIALGPVNPPAGTSLILGSPAPARRS